MRSIRSLLAVAVLATALTSAPNAWACSCILDPNDDSGTLTSPISFVGIAQDLRPRAERDYRTWGFTVLTPIRGLAPGTLETAVDLFNTDVVLDDGTVIENSCSMSFDVPGVYSVYGNAGPHGHLRIDTCGPGGFTGVP